MFSFVIVLCFILNTKSYVECQSHYPIEPGLWKTWSEKPWNWGSFLEEQYYDTVRYLEDLSDHGFSRIRPKREDKERISIAVKSIYGEVISEDAGSLPRIFEVSGEKEFVVEDNVFHLHKHEKGKLFFELVHILNIVDPVIFVESTTYMNETLVFLAHREYGQLFSLPPDQSDASTMWKNSLRKQKLSSEGNRLVKAEFLHYKDDLYLVVLYRHKKGFTVDSIVYQWKGKYFDEKYAMKTNGAVGLSVIEKDGYFIMNILQNPFGKQQQESLVYKLEPGAGLQKLHSLRTSRAKLVFNYRGVAPAHDSHVLIINGKGHSDIYRMKKGGEFVPANRKFDFMKVASGTVADIEGEDFLFLGTTSDVLIYKPMKDDLKTLNSFNVANKTILSIDYLKIPETFGDEKHNLIIITRNEFDQIELNILKFYLERDAIVSSQENDPILQCLTEVESLLHARQLQIDKIAEMTRKAITMESSSVVDVLKVSREVRLENTRNHNFQLHNVEPLHADFSDIVGAAKSTEDKIKLIEDAVSHAFIKDEKLTFTNKIVVSGDLIVEKAIATHLNIASINGNPFHSRSFISNSDTQYLPEGITEGRNITARHLTATYFNKFLQSAPVFASLSAGSVYLSAGKTVNGINPDSIVTRGFTEIILGTKTFDSLATVNLITDRLGKEKLTPWIERAINFETPTKNLKAISNVTIVNLTAKKINGFDVAELMDSTFQQGIHSEVKGNLRFLSDLDVDSLKAESLQGKAVDRFLTKTTEQIVSSDLTFRNILVGELDADKVNGIDLGKDVALVGKHNAIKTPTTLFNLDVSNDLLLNCGSDNQSFCNMVATRAEDLLQIYNGPVTIQGSVSVPDLKFGRNAKLNVGGEEFHTEVQRLFWMNEKSQVIPQDVVFTKGVSAPQVIAQRLNDLPVDEILSSTSRTNGNVSLHFEDVIFQRDVNIFGGGDCIMIGEMDRSAIKKTGSFRVKGKKTFADQLTVRSLRTDIMNDIDMRDVALKQNEAMHFTGEMRLEKVRLTGDLQSFCEVKAEVINDVVWKDFTNNDAAKVNQPTTLKSVTFHSPVFANTIIVESGPLSKMSTMINNSPKNIDVTVSGSTSLQDISEVQLVNDVNFQSYADFVVRRSNPGYVRGQKTFKGQVNVNKNFDGRILNDFPLDKLMNEALTKSEDQIVGGRHIFGDLFTGHLEAKSINGIDTKEFIDITDSEVHIDSDLSFQNLSVESYVGLNIDSPCDLLEAVKGFQLLPAKDWSQIHVEGQVFWSKSDGSLGRLFEKAVLRGNDAHIDSEVFFEGNVTSNEIETVSYLHNVDIHNINEDSVKRHSSAPQMVFGVKNIKNSLRVNDADVNNLLSSNVNGIDVLLLNATLVRNYGDVEIFGEKTVTSPITSVKLEVPGTIHGVPTDNLPFSSDSRAIKEAHFKLLTIGENLKVKKVNQVLLEDVLGNSINLRGPEQHVYGDITFENVDINGDSKIESINSMPVRDMIMDKEGEDIHVYGDKTFTQDVVLNGPAEVKVINGFDVTETYHTSLITSEDANIRGDLIFDAPVTILTDGRGLYNKLDNLNTLENGPKRLEGSKNRIGQIIHEINRKLEIVSHDIESSPTYFLYADEWSYVDLVIGSCKAAGVRSTAEESFIELHALNPGQYCGLQSYCICPQHYTIKISTDGSSTVQSDSLKYSRIFNLISPVGYSTSIITTTLAISKYCRSDINANPHNERTWISWRSGEQNAEGFFDLSGEVTGFVADVKSFYSNGGYYAIISQYYDAGLDSYNLNTIIVLLDFAQQTSTTVQRLPSFGASVMELLETKHGIILFIGNTFDSWKNSGSDSEIFRFNPSNYQFELIQSLFIQNCRAAASAILEDGISFLFLVQDYGAPLLVLRYEADQHSYSSYQMLYHDSQVLAVSVAYVGRNPVQPLLFVATSAESLVIYPHTDYEGWSINSSGFKAGIQNVIPLYLGKSQYILTPSTNKTSILELITQA